MSEFRVESNEKTSIISLPEKLTEKEAADFKNQISGWLLTPVDTFVMDFKKTVLIERQFYQTFLQFRSIVKSNDKRIYSVNLSRLLLSQIKADGLDSALSPVENIEAVQKNQ